MVSNLESLPFELLVMIFEQLKESEMNAWAQTNRHFYSLNSLLYDHNAGFKNNQAFQWAMKNNSIATAQLAHEAGLRKDKKAWTEKVLKHMFNGVKNGSFRVVSIYLSLGIDPNIRQPHRPKTLLEAAATANQPEILQLLLSQPGIHLGSHGSELLELSARLGYAEIIRILLDTPGFDANRLPPYNYTPLCWAIKSESLETVEQFFRPRVIDRIDFNKCSGSSDSTIVYHREPWKTARSPLIIAAYKRRTDMVRLLLSAPEININQQDGDRLTALHYAIYGEKFDMINLLIGHGANSAILRTARYDRQRLLDEEL